MNTLEILTKARAKIEKFENWTQGSYAEDADGYVVDTANPKACRFCALGAIESVTGDNVTRFLASGALTHSGALYSGFGEEGDYDVPELNDGHMPLPDGTLPTPEQAHAQVLAMYDLAIAKETA